MYAKIYDQFMEAEGAVEEKTSCGRGVRKMPVESQGASLLNDHIKFCGLLDSLGEQSFAHDKDMTIRESLLRKKEGYGARKFFTVNNKMLVGLEPNTGGSKRDLALEPTSSKYALAIHVAEHHSQTHIVWRTGVFHVRKPARISAKRPSGPRRRRRWYEPSGCLHHSLHPHVQESARVARG